MDETNNNYDKDFFFSLFFLFLHSHSYSSYSFSLLPFLLSSLLPFFSLLLFEMKKEGGKEWGRGRSRTEDKIIVKICFHNKLKIFTSCLSSWWNINPSITKIPTFHVKLKSYFQSSLFIDKNNVMIIAMWYLSWRVYYILILSLEASAVWSFFYHNECKYWDFINQTILIIYLDRRVFGGILLWLKCWIWV